MKVITEERLMYLIENDGDGSKVYCTVSTADLEELDTLTVTKLRPMSEAQRKPPQFILACNHHNELFKVQYVVQYGRWFLEDGHTSFKDDALIGWIPMPTYNPEEK